jgi:predicted transcriptional regulator
MHPNALNAVCAAASTPSLRILRALNLLQVPQRPEEIAEGLELCLSVVTHELSKLEAAGIVRTIDEQIHLGVHLSSFFGEPLTPSTTEPPCQRERKAIRV